MTGTELLEAARDQRVVPLFYEADAARARGAVEGLVRGGAQLVEFTLRGPGAERVLARLVEAAPDGVAIGAGSVTDAASAQRALDAGAAFVVGPNGDPAVARRCADAGVGYVPGCLTATEVVEALRWGSTLVKVFPAGAVGGPTYVRALRGPLPNVAIMATGGVGVGDLRRYLEAGAVCVGMGSELVRREWVRDGDTGAIAAAMGSVLTEGRSFTGGAR